MAKSPSANYFLSIIILNYNSGDYLSKCLESISKSDCHNFEIIVVDNASTDDSILKITKSSKRKAFELKTIKNTLNPGFSAGNNIGLKHISPKTTHVLFLNPDTTIKSNTLSTMLEFFHSNSSIDAATCKIILAKTGQLQPECHRGFPTPWRSFCHFSGLAKLFPKSPVFNGYFQGHLDIATSHQIEACVGAFLMLKKEVGQIIGWWNESYFFYGDDLDLCFQIQKNHYQLWYTPATSITHYQGISSGLKKHTQNLSSASRLTKIKAAQASTQAMRIFYQRNYFTHYNFLTKFLVNLGINFLEFIRVTKVKYL